MYGRIMMTSVLHPPPPGLPFFMLIRFVYMIQFVSQRSRVEYIWRHSLRVRDINQLPNFNERSHEYL